MKKLQEGVDQHNSFFIESESQTTFIFDQFQPVDVSEVITLVQRAPKLCELDPLPSKVLLKHLNPVAPLFTDIINESLTSGVFPENLKEALLRPLLKKKGLDLILSNNHPVSFVSKLIEWVGY